MIAISRAAIEKQPTNHDFGIAILTALRKSGRMADARLAYQGYLRVVWNQRGPGSVRADEGPRGAARANYRRECASGNGEVIRR